MNAAQKAARQMRDAMREVVEAQAGIVPSFKRLFVGTPLPPRRVTPRLYEIAETDEGIRLWSIDQRLPEELRPKLARGENGEPLRCPAFKLMSQCGLYVFEYPDGRLACYDHGDLRPAVSK